MKSKTSIAKSINNGVTSTPRKKFSFRNPFARFRRSSINKVDIIKTKKRNYKRIFGRVFGILFGIGLFVGSAGLITISVWLKEIEKDLPKPGQLVDRKTAQSTTIYTRNGESLYNIFDGEQNRYYIKLSDLSPETQKNLIVALLSAEDWDFYNHKGLDWTGILYCTAISAQSYLTNGDMGGQCGASTLSQQLVRNTLMKDVFGAKAFDRSTPVNTAIRKIREWLLTMQVEQTLTKDQMLEMYVNEIAMGGVNYGFQAGARSIYDKNIDELSLAEMVALSGVIPSPSTYNPITGTKPDKLKDRQSYIYEQMSKHKEALNFTLEQKGLPKLTDEDISTAKDTEVQYKAGKINIIAPHFVFYVKDQLVDMFGEELVETGGLKVTTTMDLEVFNIAQEELKNGVSNYGHRYGVMNGAVVVLYPRNGQVLAMVGSVDYDNSEDKRIDGKVNVATSNRQMGSAVKPITYLTAFERGMGPNVEAADVEEIKFNYNARNWDDQYYGIMTAREALVKSRNIPALYMMQTIGVDGFINSAEKLGIKSLKDRSNYGLSLTLGAGEMKLLELTGAYSVFATEGVRHDITAIMKVEDSQGNVIYEVKDNSTRVFSERDIYLLNWTLCDLGGFGDPLMNHIYYRGGGRLACSKGGTTNGPRDLTGFLYHKNLVVGIWNGNNNNIETPGAYSTTISLPIGVNIIARLQHRFPTELYGRPGGISEGTICKDTGRAASESNPCEKTYSIYKSENTPSMDSREVIKVCKVNGKIPTNLSQAERLGIVEDKQYMKEFAIDNRDQIDNFNKFLREKRGIIIGDKPEEDVCPLPLGPENEPVIDITKPVAGTLYKAGDTISVSYESLVLEEVQSVKVYFEEFPSVYKVSDKLMDTVDLKIPVTASGDLTIYAQVTDNLGAISMSKVTVEVDAITPPVVISFLTPTATTVEIPFSISVKTSVPVTAVQYSLVGTGGNIVATLMNGDTSNTTWTSNISNSLPDGDYTATFEVIPTGEKLTKVIKIKKAVIIPEESSGGSQ